MTHEENAAYIMARLVRAQIKVAAMQALNLEREYRGHAPAYDEDSFLRVIGEEQIGENDILAQIQQIL